MKKLIDILINTKITALLLVLFIFMMAYATFIENDFGTQTARYHIYNSFLFEFVMFLLCLNFIGNISRYKLFHKDKIWLLIFHLAFVIIIIGAFFTRYFGFEGTMHIREEKSSDHIVSEDTFISIIISNDSIQKNYSKKILLSGMSSNNFSKNIDFLNEKIKVKINKFVPNAERKIVEEDNNTGVFNLMVLYTDGQKEDIFIKRDEVKNLGGIFEISFNKNLEGDININFDGDTPVISSKEDLEVLDMYTMRKDTLHRNTDKIFEKKIYSFRGIKFVLKEYSSKGGIKYISTDDNSKEDLLLFEIVNNNEKQILEVFGKKGVVNSNNWTTINNLNVSISYGSRHIKIPFSIRLNKFLLEKYPGSNSPKSFESKISLIDNNKVTDHRIFMNNTLKHKGYKFFQASYDSDGKGTVLSVNYDNIGTITTYIGYILMTLGMFGTLFSNTRFRKLLNSLSQNKNVILLMIFLTLTSTVGAKNVDSIIQKNIIDKTHAKNFSSILIQDPQGRIKPINTLALQVIRKVYGKETYNGLDANQIFLSMVYDPHLWQKVPLVEIKNREVAKLINPDLKYFSFEDFFDESYNYKILDQVSEAYSKLDKNRNEFDKAIIKTDEKLNILFSIFNKKFLTIYPLEGDDNNAWYNSLDAKFFFDQDSIFVRNIEKYYFSEIDNILKNNLSWHSADSIVSHIKLFQNKKSSQNILPSTNKIKAEIYYNEASIFQKLYKWYTSLGGVSLILFFLIVFKKNKIYNKIFLGIKYIFVLLFLYHTFGLILRWYISGHAPWSNGYESMVYIAWGIVLGGIIFSHKSKILIPASLLTAGLTLFVSKLSLFDPQITNLVPVLNSYWLIIHVAVITISYSFFAIATIVAFIVLVMMIFKTESNKHNYNSIIKEFNIINEITLTVGIFLLSIGTFLGGVWANESWGRYWGWDPKETWALISIMVYAFILHIRLIPKLRGFFIFNLATVLGFLSILMTYFGVNYYLSGMHSYAKGDPIPIPNFVYYTLIIIFIVSVLAYVRNKKSI